MLYLAFSFIIYMNLKDIFAFITEKNSKCNSPLTIYNKLLFL